MIENPPPPQMRVTDQTFVPFETDDYAQAHAWACEQLVRKYPGATGMVENLKSLIDQKLNA